MRPRASSAAACAAASSCCAMRCADRYANAAVAMLDGLPPGCEMAWALSNRAQLRMLCQRRRRSRRMGHASHRAGDPSRRLRGAGPCAEQRRHGRGRAGRRRRPRQGRAQPAAGAGARLPRARGACLLHPDQRARDPSRIRRRAALHRAAAAYFAARDLDSWSSYVLAWEVRLHFGRSRGVGTSRLPLRASACPAARPRGQPARSSGRVRTDGRLGVGRAMPRAAARDGCARRQASEAVQDGSQPGGANDA